MRYLLFIFLLISCQKATPVLMPDMMKHATQADAARLYSEPTPEGGTDTLMYLRVHLGRINTVRYKFTDVGVNTYYDCAGRYELFTTALVINWTKGPMKGVKEVLRPVDASGRFTRLESEQRGFWIEN